MAAASAHQVSLSLNYEKDKSQLALVPTNDPVLSKEPQICKTRYYIQEDGLYNPGDNWQYFMTDSKSFLAMTASQAGWPTFRRATTTKTAMDPTNIYV